MSEFKHNPLSKVDFLFRRKLFSGEEAPKLHVAPRLSPLQDMQAKPAQTKDKIPGVSLGRVFSNIRRFSLSSYQRISKEPSKSPQKKPASGDTRKNSPLTRDTSRRDMLLAQQAFKHFSFVEAMESFLDGTFTVTSEADVAEILAARVMLKFNGKIPGPTPNKLLQVAGLDAMVPVTWQGKKSELNWARAVYQQKGKVISGGSFDSLFDSSCFFGSILLIHFFLFPVISFHLYQ